MHAPSPREIYLVRHGETAWSLTGRHTGLTDLPLTERGQRQAQRLRERLGAMSFTHVFSSPLQRARRTSELAGFAGAIVLDPDLYEWNYGRYEGRTLPDIRRGQPDWELFRDGCPGGESVAEITERVDRVVARLRTFPGRVLIFSSGHVLRVLASRWVAAPTMLGRALVLDPACVSVLGYDHGESDRVIRLWNDARGNVVPAGREGSLAESLGIIRAERNRNESD